MVVLDGSISSSSNSKHGELLIRATATIPLGTAYAVWTGIGAVGTVLVGIVFFQESADFWRIFFILTLIGSIIGLKVLSH